MLCVLRWARCGTLRRGTAWTSNVSSRTRQWRPVVMAAMAAAATMATMPAATTAAAAAATTMRQRRPSARIFRS
eukprot:3090571-Prymnesium_polylepis.1